MSSPTSKRPSGRLSRLLETYRREGPCLPPDQYRRLGEWLRSPECSLLKLLLEEKACLLTLQLVRDNGNDRLAGRIEGLEAAVSEIDYAVRKLK
jgi:hypothetical protein